MIALRLRLTLSLLFSLSLLSMPLVWAEQKKDYSTAAFQQNVNWDRMPLSMEQKQAMQKHDVLWQRAFEQLYPEIQAERQRLRQLLLQPDTDHNAIFKALRQLEDKEQELRYEAVKNFLLKKEELTPAQRQQLQQQVTVPCMGPGATSSK
jgi:Spy/CpxP family protein refolding chaperone